jgi:hypothetical protein
MTPSRVPASLSPATVGSLRVSAAPGRRPGPAQTRHDTVASARPEADSGPNGSSESDRTRALPKHPYARAGTNSTAALKKTKTISMEQQAAPIPKGLRLQQADMRVLSQNVALP